MEYSFEPRPNSRALGTAGSVITIGLSIKKDAHTGKTSLTNLVLRVRVTLVQRNGPRCLFRWTRGTRTLGTRLQSDDREQD